MNNFVDPFLQNQILGFGINLANSLEAPNEGDWGLFLKEEYFEDIKSAGFNSIRLPINWSVHASQNFPFTISSEFFNRIDWAIQNCFNNNLAVIINVQNYLELFKEPVKHIGRFLTLWNQIANHYQNYPTELFFEILNEPHGSLNSTIWNDLLYKSILQIRKTNPNRTLLIGTANWGGLKSLENLLIPPEEKNCIVTFHYYQPFKFTHQGTGWVKGSDNWIGTKWENTKEEQSEILNDFQKAILWSKKNNIPINLGEFGVYNKADSESRFLWTKFVSQLAALNNFSWHYWEFGGSFGIYDIQKQKWNEKMLTALFQLA